MSCVQSKIIHVTAAIGKPATVGKIERPRFKTHRQFIKYYNNKGVHVSLNYMTSRQMYTRRRSVTHVSVTHVMR
ncbi:MAG: hypothetical protein DA328_09030 [Nitrososphaeraceae archaeon]|nr:hypothetical protein [Nitrososphaeraceae archaeon]